MACRRYGRRLRGMHQHKVEGALKLTDLLDHACLAQFRPGEDGFIVPATIDGQEQVMLPEMLVGLMLEMVAGSELTPKGGLTKLLDAHKAAEPMPTRDGVYGRGCYKDEPWGLVAIRKRLTSTRKFYERHLEGDKLKVNPGWQPIVKATMVSIALLLGDEPKHVRV